MKKLLLLITVLSMSLVGCEPMDDIYDELDTDVKIQGAVDYTLTDDDYEELDLSYGNFNSVEDAKDIIPGFLSDKFPAWGKGSLANVSFMVFNPKQDEKSLIVYEATSEDGDEFGSRFGNFDRLSQVEDLLNAKFGDEPNRTLVSLTYDWYTSTTGEVERNDGFLLLDGEWVFITGITEAEYAALGESYPDFSSEDEAMEKIPAFLNNKYNYENFEKGDIKGVMYNLYQKDYDDVDRDGKTDESFDQGFVVYFMYDGNEWVEYNNSIEQSVQFGNDGVNWIPDNTIQYSFKTEDYALAASELADVYSAQAENLAGYGNFNRGGGSTSWNDEMMLAAINVVLDNLAPTAKVGQKYVVSYVIYAGGYTTESKAVIKNAEGDWVYQE